MQPQKKQILIIDDRQEMCEMMTLLLGFSNYQVRCVQTMAEGWRMVQERAIDLCLLDSRLPDGSGFELCRRICALSPSLPVVFYSGDAYEKDRRKGLAAGAQAYLIKPNDLDKIAEVIGEVLQNSSSPL